MTSKQPIEIVVFEKNEILFLENEQSYHFYVIQSGEVEVFKSGENGEKQILATVGPGTSIGEYAMLDRKPRSASARALTTVQAARVSEEAYQTLLNDLPEWAVAVMRGLIERVRASNQIIRQQEVTDKKTLHALESAEFDDSGSFTNTSPFLTPTGEDE